MQLPDLWEEFYFFVLFSAVTRDDGQQRLEMHRGCCHPPSPSAYLTTEVCASDTHRGEHAARIQWNAIQKLWGSNEEIWHSCNINQCAVLFLDWDRVSSVRGAGRQPAGFYCNNKSTISILTWTQGTVEPYDRDMSVTPNGANTRNIHPTLFTRVELCQPPVNGVAKFTLITVSL